DFPADSIEMRSEAASRTRRYSTTLGQGASLRSAPTRWPRKLSGDGASVAAAGAARARTARLNASIFGRGLQGIGRSPLGRWSLAHRAAEEFSTIFDFRA